MMEENVSSRIEDILMALPEEDREEIFRPWEPWLIDLRWVQWIIAEFQGLDNPHEVDHKKVKEWMIAHGQEGSFSRCRDCGSENIQHLRERWELGGIAPPSAD